MVGTALTRAAAMLAGTLALAGPAAAQPPPDAGTPDGPAQIRAHVRALEAALGAAVSRSANAVENQLPAGVPRLVLFAGPIQVQGFRLEDYGVFFVVEYPVLRRSIVWSMQRLDPFELSMDVTLQILRRFPPVDRQVAFPPGGRPAAGRAGTPPVPLERVGGGGGGARGSAHPPHAPGGGDAVPDPAAASVDPQRVYQGALRASLTDALVLSGRALAGLLPEDAWLTVAARDVTGRGGRDGRLRVGARDLVAFAEGRTSLDEVRERVEATGF